MAVAGTVLEVIGEFRQRLLGLLELQIVEQIAIVGATGAAEDDVLLVAIEVVGKTKARLPLVLLCAAVVPVADVVVDVDAAEGQRLRIGLAGGRRSIRIRAVQRGNDIGRRDVIEIGR